MAVSRCEIKPPEGLGCLTVPRPYRAQWERLCCNHNASVNAEYEASFSAERKRCCILSLLNHVSFFSEKKKCKWCSTCFLQKECLAQCQQPRFSDSEQQCCRQGLHPGRNAFSTHLFTAQKRRFRPLSAFSVHHTLLSLSFLTHSRAPSPLLRVLWRAKGRESRSAHRLLYVCPATAVSPTRRRRGAHSPVRWSFLSVFNQDSEQQWWKRCFPLPAWVLSVFLWTSRGPKANKKDRKLNVSLLCSLA